MYCEACLENTENLICYRGAPNIVCGTEFRLCMDCYDYVSKNESQMSMYNMFNAIRKGVGMTDMGLFFEGIKTLNEVWGPTYVRRSNEISVKRNINKGD
jgi:hypothetical protein